MKKIILLVLLIILACLLYDDELFLKSKRPEWIQSAKLDLRAFVPQIGQGEIYLPTIRDNKSQYVYDFDDKTVLRFKDGSWAYFRIHSFHSDEYFDKKTGKMQIKKDGVGDVILAVSSSNELYYLKGHCCAVVTVEKEDGSEIKSASEFFENSARTSAGVEKWTKIDWDFILK